MAIEFDEKIEKTGSGKTRGERAGSEMERENYLFIKNLEMLWMT